MPRQAVDYLLFKDAPQNAIGFELATISFRARKQFRGAWKTRPPFLVIGDKLVNVKEQLT